MWLAREWNGLQNSVDRCPHARPDDIRQWWREQRRPPRMPAAGIAWRQLRGLERSNPLTFASARARQFLRRHYFPIAPDDVLGLQPFSASRGDR
jgi:hypothetical protein